MENLIAFIEFKFTESAIYALMVLLQLSLLTYWTPDLLGHLASMSESFINSISFRLAWKQQQKKLYWSQLHFLLCPVAQEKKNNF